MTPRLTRLTRLLRAYRWVLRHRLPRETANVRDLEWRRGWFFTDRKLQRGRKG